MDLAKCSFTTIRSSEFKYIEVMLYCHPLYHLYNQDPIIFKEFEDYKNAHLMFIINYN